MNKRLEHIVRTTIKDVLSEQEQQASAFDDSQKKFLGSFALAGAQHLGILYSMSDIGVREFVARSGAQYNCTPAVLLSLLRGKYIKIVPYTGYGRDTDYTIELQLPLDAVQPFAELAGAKDGEGADGAAAPAGGDTGGGGGGGSFGGGGGGLPPIDDLGGGDTPPAEGDAPPAEGEPLPDEPPAEEEPAPDLAHVVKYGDLLRESVKISNQLMLEASKSKKKSSKVKDVKIHLSKSRILRRVPREFIYQLKRVIHKMQGRTFNKREQERLIADILDTLQLNFNLTPRQIHLAYEFHRNQKRLQKFLDKD